MRSLEQIEELRQITQNIIDKCKMGLSEQQEEINSLRAEIKSLTNVPVKSQRQFISEVSSAVGSNNYEALVKTINDFFKEHNVLTREIHQLRTVLKPFVSLGAEVLANTTLGDSDVVVNFNNEVIKVSDLKAAIEVFMAYTQE